jgi:hypothetical protein
VVDHLFGAGVLCSDGEFAACGHLFRIMTARCSSIHEAGIP